MSLPANMATQAATGSTTWAKCAKITTQDGVIIGLTEHDVAIAVDLSDGDGEITYTPADAVEFSDGRVATDLAVDNIEIIGAVEDARINADDIHGGRYEHASVTFFEVDWTNPSGGQKIAFTGPIGEVETRATEFVFEVRSITAKLGRNIAQTIGTTCRRSFGSTSATERPPQAACGVNLNPPAWMPGTAYTATSAGDRQIGSRVKPTTHNGFWYACTTAGTSDAASPDNEPIWPTTVGDTVTDGTVVWTTERALSFPGTVATVPTRLSITATGISVEADFFARGYVEWLTGDNADRGVKSPVSFDSGSGALSFYRAPIKPVKVGDTFTVFRGCDKSQAACIVFSNWLNNNGHFYVPPTILD